MFYIMVFNLEPSDCRAMQDNGDSPVMKMELVSPEYQNNWIASLAQSLKPFVSKPYHKVRAAELTVVLIWNKESFFI